MDLEQQVAERIADWILEYGWDYYPITDYKGVPCEHGVYSWDECGQCNAIQLADDIRNGKWKE